MSFNFIKHVRNIPTLPTVLNQIIQTLDAPDSSAAELEKIVRNDQAITTKLLAVANSSYYGFRHQITTVRHAVVAVGFNEVRNVCLGLSLMGFLHPSTFSDREMAEQLWLHSLAASEAARILATRTKACEPAQAFTAGLLHDIGKVVMAAFAPDQMRSLQDYIAKEDCSFWEAEYALNLSHEAVGRELAKHWDLPPVLAQVIGSHHSLEPDTEELPLVALINTADYLARDLAIGDSGNCDEPRLHPFALKGLRSELSVVEECRQDLKEQEAVIRRQWDEMMRSRRGS
jgi:putative nucleotidyltransferase with HDIG domain